MILKKSDQVSYGFVVDQWLSVPAISGSTTDAFLSYLTYHELPGYVEYDGLYDGYPASETHLVAPAIDFSALFSIQDTTAIDTFDSPVYAVASWHHVLNKNLEPKQLQHCLGQHPWM